MNGFAKSSVAVLCALICIISAANAQDDLQRRFDEAFRLQAQEPSVIVPRPIPDPRMSRPAPELEYCRPENPAAASQQFEGLYFVRFFAGWCGPCRQMESAGVFDDIKAAGYKITEVDIDKAPDKRVTSVPTLWLCDANRSIVRQWVGYQTTDDILNSQNCYGIGRLRAANKLLSGVCISENLFLTVAHHDSQGPFLIELPVDRLDNTKIVSFPATLVRADTDSDLCLLRFRCPPDVTIKTLELATTNLEAMAIEGFPSGKPKKIRAKNTRNTVRLSSGSELLELVSPDISSPQLGMSGGPALNSAGEIMGIQSLGSGNQISVAQIETIRGFVGDDLHSAEQSAIVNISNSANGDLQGLLAAAVGLHCLSEDLPDVESAADAQIEGTFGSLVDVDFDVPDSALEIASRLLTLRKVEFPAAGVELSWNGDARRIDLKPDRITVTPGMEVKVQKFGLTKRCRLDAVTYTQDLSSVTFELSGMLDVTVNLK
ncbi:MAG: trypsin-like peptidase domain-containing protein [Planctomyces sp.]|nr:trypsin-like peptidase domain-containing protein [Planctomyces sp.]